jgi:TM2 domain-containing membrane protein YozV
MANGKEPTVNFYMADGDTRRGPFPMDQLIAQGLRPDMLVWCEGMAEWLPAHSVPELRMLMASPAVPPPMQAYAVHPDLPGYAGVRPYDRNEVNSKRITAGVLGILLGGLGIHKFVLGMTGAGLIMLLVTVCSCGFGWIVMHVIGLVEGIIYLTKTDEEFYRLYMVEKKAWF